MLRHPANKPSFYRRVLEVLENEFPEVRARFELQLLPFRKADVSRYRLCIPWLQDPVQSWSVRAYERMDRIAEQLDGRGVPTINPVAKLTNAAKVSGSERIRSAGIRTARTVEITDLENFRETGLGLQLPILIRDDWGHASKQALARGAVIRCDTEQERRDANLQGFRRPIAIEFIETKSPDGLYRKYRHFAMGDMGFPHHVQMKYHWYVKGEEGGRLEYSDAIREEELAFVHQPDPNTELLQKARRALDLDYVAFDYSYDQSGNLVVWEANPLPIIAYATDQWAYKNHIVIRTILGMAQMYLTRAGLPVPDELKDRTVIRPA